MVLRSDVSGKIQMKCFLTVRRRRAGQRARRRADGPHTRPSQGMPELKLGLNDRLSVEGGSTDGPSSMHEAGPSGGGSGGARRVARRPLRCAHAAFAAALR